MVAAALLLLAVAAQEPPFSETGRLTSGPPPGPSEWYLALVERYRGGDREAALAEEAPPEKFLYEISALSRLVTVVRRAPSAPLRQKLERISIPAAVMLHTDRAFRMFELYDPAAPAELELPPRLLALMDDEPRQALEPLWTRATALELNHLAEWDLALDLLDPALKRYPDDALMLMARGAALEALSLRAEDIVAGAAMFGPYVPKLERAQRASQRASQVARKHLGEAEKSYRRTLALRPDLHHARLRLARVLQLLGRPEASVADLQSLSAQATEARDRYLARLFLGYAHEKAGRLDSAVAEYERAARALPDGQAAAVALSHALHRAGRWPASVEALQSGVARAGRRLVIDPWWPYVTGQSEDQEALLEALRADVSR